MGAYIIIGLIIVAIIFFWLRFRRSVKKEVAEKPEIIALKKFVAKWNTLQVELERFFALDNLFEFHPRGSEQYKSEFNETMNWSRSLSERTRALFNEIPDPSLFEGEGNKAQLRDIINKVKAVCISLDKANDFFSMRKKVDEMGNP